MILRDASAILFVSAIVITSIVSGGHSQAPIELTMQIRVFDPKYDSPKHGKGITVNSAVSFRHGEPVRLVNGGETDLPGFDEPQQFGVTIDVDTRLQRDGTALINLKLQTSSRFVGNRQEDLHLVVGQTIHASCPVTLGKPRTIQCSDGRSLEILLERSK